MQRDSSASATAPVQNAISTRQAAIEAKKMNAEGIIALGLCTALFGGLYLNLAFKIAYETRVHAYHSTSFTEIFVHIHKEPLNDNDMFHLNTSGSIVLAGLGMICYGIYDYWFE